MREGGVLSILIDKRARAKFFVYVSGFIFNCSNHRNRARFKPPFNYIIRSKSERRLLTQINKHKQCSFDEKKCSFVISVYVAAAATNTRFQDVPSAEELVVLNFFRTQVGVTTNRSAVITCPTTALYFVRYRLATRALPEPSEPCTLNFFVPGFPAGIPVSFVNAHLSSGQEEPSSCINN